MIASTFTGWQPDLLALMRAGRIGRMKPAGDDTDGDLALALGERVTAGVERGPEWPPGFRSLYPDFARPGEPATALDHCAIALVLLRRHLFIRDLSITTKGWRIRHFGFLPGLCGQVLGLSSGRTSSARMCSCSSARLFGIPGQWIEATR